MQSCLGSAGAPFLNEKNKKQNKTKKPQTKTKNNNQSTLHVDDPETLEKAQLCSTMLLQEDSEVGS